MTNRQYPTTKEEVIAFVDQASAETIAHIEHALMLRSIECKVAKLSATLVGIRPQQGNNITQPQ